MNYSKAITAVLVVSFAASMTALLAQNFVVDPYLQDGKTDAMSILWETSSGEESTVEWGETWDLGNSTAGTSSASNGSAIMHSVTIEGLTPYSTYHYRVVTGALVSGMHSFRTSPLSTSEQDFRFVAMSDMQQSASDPNVFHEVIHDGVLDYIEGDPTEELAFILIPGDLVVTGTTYSQWQSTFFTPAADLIAEVPTYPVLGNHEVNAAYYFQYFQLPENGTPGYEEHWWFKDYGNVRLLGLDSNGPYNGQEQLDWLEQTLESTCAESDIDFVFAQLHHPHKSELWTPGESNFTGDVVELLEAFTENCGKPSVHFFGHTHGYSRGQSRDHKHLWINVASAGGAIDYWGEWPQADYDEFEVSEDDWGFVMVDVQAGNDPQFTVKRLSRGDNYTNLDNALIDSLVIKKASSEVDTPTPIYPVDVDIAPQCVVLEADAFIGSTSTQQEHGATHWQVAGASNSFDAPIAESWERWQNIYFNEDTQAGESITEQPMMGLPSNSDLWWRVRYRDRELNWSDWSDPASFSTGQGAESENLVVNPGAENDLSNWTITEGVVESLEAEVCAGVEPYEGERYFAVGGLCTESEVGRMEQEIDVTVWADSIDAGNYTTNYGAMLRDWSGYDLPEIQLHFLDDSDYVLGSTGFDGGTFTSWTSVFYSADLPPSTRTIRCELRGTRYSGADNDSYVDNIFVHVGSANPCDPTSIYPVQFDQAPTELEVYPNPATESATLKLPKHWQGEVLIRLTDSLGRKVDTSMQREGNELIIHRNGLASGTYFITLIGELNRASAQCCFY